MAILSQIRKMIFLIQGNQSGYQQYHPEGTHQLPTVFELTGDARWDKGGELYLAYDLHLDNDAVEQALYPDEETVVDQDIIFDDHSVTAESKPGVKALSGKSYSEVLKMVDDFRKSEQAKDSIDATNFNLSKEFSEILSPGRCGMVN
jgi:hypothetical protein